MGKKLIIKGADFSKNGILPEFTQLAWIGGPASTKSALLSPVALTSKCKVITTFSYDASKANAPAGPHYMFGLISSNTSMCLSQNTAGTYLYFKDMTVYCRNGVTDISNGNTYTIESSILGLKIGDKTIIPPTGAVSDYNLSMFGLDCGVSQGGNAQNFSKSNSDPAMRLMSIKIYSDYNDEKSLVIDAIPVRRTSDGCICLYNKVDGTYITRTDGTNPAYGM